jgi:peptide/nickel transport system substrate-binding protein
LRPTIYLVTTLLIILGLLTACAPAAAPTAVPTKPASAPALPTVAPTKPAAQPAPSGAIAAAPAAKIKRGGTLRVGMQNDWMGFDPPFTQSVFSTAHMVFDGLVRWRADDKGMWGPQPGLATEWELQGKTATFKLRQGVKFQDGTNFDAQVAKWNLDRMIKDPKSRMKSTFDAVDTVEVVDPSTIRLNLKAPMAPLPALLTDGHTFISSQAAFEKLGLEEFNRNPVGSGPFTMASWKTGDQVTLKRYEKYWEKGADGEPLPYLDSIVYRLLADDTMRALDLKAGNLDFTERLVGKDLPGLKAAPDLVVLEARAGSMSYRLGFNNESGPFNNVKLRQAVLWAIDRDAIARVLGVGVGEPAYYPLLPGAIGYDESIPKYSLNPAKAKQALSENDTPDGVDVTLIAHNRQLDTQQAQMLKQMLDAVNIRTTLEVGERTSNVQKREAGHFQMTALVHTGTVDPDVALAPQLACGAVGNWVRYCSKEFDKCLEEGRSNYDPKQRNEIYKRCQTMLFNDAPDTFFWRLPYIYAHNKKVQGFIQSMTEYFEFRYTWLQS